MLCCIASDNEVLRVRGRAKVGQSLLIQWISFLQETKVKLTLKLLLLSRTGHVLTKREPLSLNSCFSESPCEFVTAGLISPPALSFIKMAHFYSLAVLAFAGGWCLCAADVGDFAPCLQVFYKSWPPKGLTGTPICQRYYNQYRFATLYSRPRRSPWFSAYLYTVPAGKRPTSSWKFEPQVRILKYYVVWFIDLKRIYISVRIPENEY